MDAANLPTRSRSARKTCHYSDAVRSFDPWLVSALDDGPCRVDWHALYAPSATN